MSRWVLSKPFDSGNFSADNGATPLMVIRGIQGQAETAQQGDVHKSIVRELQHLVGRVVADPFEGWTKGYHVRPVIVVCLPVFQLTAFRKRDCRPTSLMAILRTTNEIKPRYASFSLSLLGRPVKLFGADSSHYNLVLTAFPQALRVHPPGVSFSSLSLSPPLSACCASSPDTEMNQYIEERAKQDDGGWVNERARARKTSL